MVLCSGIVCWVTEFLLVGVDTDVLFPSIEEQLPLELFALLKRALMTRCNDGRTRWCRADGLEAMFKAPRPCNENISRRRRRL